MKHARKLDLIDTRQAWSVCPAMPSHRDQIEELWLEFSKPDAELLDVALDPDHENYEYNQVFSAVTQNGDLVGFAVACRCGQEWLLDALGVEVLEHRVADRNGYLHTLCVDPDYREQGIGSQLVKTRLEWLASHDVEATFGVAWLPEEGPSSRYLFEKFGFEELAHVREYYYRDIDPRRWCPDCGEPCECDAKIYGREI
jgi:GNAT superfamily N-acetyltransferase